MESMWRGVRARGSGPARVQPQWWGGEAACSVCTQKPRQRVGSSWQWLSVAMWGLLLAAGPLTGSHALSGSSEFCIIYLFICLFYQYYDRSV